MRRFILLLALVGLLATAPEACPERSRRARAGRPNFLWLIAEDFGPHLGCYGTQQVWTPNLDRLAAEGVRYTRFYTTAPVCSPSRSAFMTGMYQTTIGAHNHRSHRDDGYRLPDGVRVLTDWMRDAGYFTANLRTFPASADPGKGITNVGTGKTDWNFLYEGKPFDSDNWSALKTHQPFYAQINFKETHRAFVSPRRADPAKVEIPPYYPDHPVTREDWAKYLDAATELDEKVGRILQQLKTDGLADDTIIIFFGDNGQAHVRGKQFCYEEGLHVPLIIRWPKKFPMPQRFRPGTVSDQLLMSIDLAPTMLHLAEARIPPKMQGRVFLGFEAPSNSILGVLRRDSLPAPRQYVFGARDRCDETVFRFRTVRDVRYRYIRNFTPERPFLQPNNYKERQYPVWNLLKQLDAEAPNNSILGVLRSKLTPPQKVLAAPTMPAEELYDLDKDPHEINNLANSPTHQPVLKRLRAALERWIEESNDQGRQLEPPDLAARKGLTQPTGDPNAPAIKAGRSMSLHPSSHS